jgi:hypothetical protein
MKGEEGALNQKSEHDCAEFDEDQVKCTGDELTRERMRAT